MEGRIRRVDVGFPQRLAYDDVFGGMRLGAKLRSNTSTLLRSENGRQRLEREFVSGVTCV